MSMAAENKRRLAGSGGQYQRTSSVKDNLGSRRTDGTVRYLTPGGIWCAISSQSASARNTARPGPFP